MPHPQCRHLLLNRWFCTTTQRSLQRYLLGGLLGIAAPLFAQVAPPVPPAANPDDASSHDDKSSPPGVSVPDSPGAQERIDKAREKELQKQWKTAAEYYQEALIKYPGRVIPIRRDPESGIFHYEGIAPIVQERMAKWPADALTIYRNQYGQTAADLLAAAPHGDIAALRNLFWNYFLTDAGKTASIQLLDTYLEDGDFHAAAWVGNRLLTLQPTLAADRSLVAYRTALACIYSGNIDAGRKLLEQLRKQSPNDVGSIGGKDVVLVDSLAALLEGPPIKPTTRPTDADTYPSFGGLGGRGDVSPSVAKPGASLNSVALARPEWNGMMNSQKAMYQNADDNSLANGLAMGVMPVVDAGALFFQDGRNVYAVDADSGSPLPGWLNTYPERAGRYKFNAFGRARNELLTLSVTPTAVIAVMGQPDHPPANGNINGNFPPQQLTPSTVKLVCLDRDTGRELWTRTPADLPDSIAVLHTAEYSGTPVVLPASQAGRVIAANGITSSAPAEDSVLITARGSKENQFDDCYVVCLSLKTGQYKWSSYVGSATRNFDADGMAAIQPSQMSIADGRIFVMTNLGSVASLDPSDGRVLWLNSYARENVESPEAMFLGGRRRMNQMQNTTPTGHAWTHNPVIVSDGYVYILPVDTKQLFVYDAATGEEAKRMPMSAFDNASVMLGVQNGVVCLTSDKGIFAVDWRKYAESNPILPWSEPDVSGGGINLPDALKTEPNSICGRGFVTADSIYVPTKFRLIQTSWRSGKTLRVYPAEGVFNGDQGPGNILVTSNNVIIAGQERVDVYTDLTLVKQRYEAAMAASPNDPEPRMRYAEALFAGGQSGEAIVHVDEAINLTGGLSGMHSGKNRSMIFNSMLDFAARVEKTGDKNRQNDIIELANQFYDRAARAAETPSENARYHMARAMFDGSHKDFAGEVRLCQEILSDDTLRAAVLMDDSQAGAAAEAAIDDVIRNKEHDAYAPVELLAQAALKTAMTSDDPQQLLKVAAIYPNSNAANYARQEAVQRFEAANQPDKAIDVLRRLYLGTSDRESRAHLLESIANDFLTSPQGVGPAIDRLCLAARIAPSQRLSQKLHLPDGKVMSDTNYAEAIAALRQVLLDQDTAALPDFHLALPKPHQDSPFVPGADPISPAPARSADQIAKLLDTVAIPNVGTIVHPLVNFVRNDQILTYASNGLSIYPAGQTSPLATIAEINDMPLAAAWTHDSWIVWTATRVFAVTGDGKLAWTFNASHLPALPVSSGGDQVIDDTGENSTDENAAQRGNAQVVGGGQVIVNVQVQRRFIRGGNNVVVAPPAPPVIRLGEEEIVGVVPTGPVGAQAIVYTSTGRILALDTRNGQSMWETRPVDHAVDTLLANGHFTVARMDDPGGSQIAVLDTVTGRLIGRRRYGPDNTPKQLINVALSEEGTLALTLFSEMQIKELYDAWKVPPQILTAQANRDNAPFTGLNQPNQLLVKGGRLVGIYDSSKYIRAYDLSKNGDPSNPLFFPGNPTSTTLRMVGSRVFIVSNSAVKQYNLQDPAFYSLNARAQETGDKSSTPDEVDWTPQTCVLLLGKNHAVVAKSPSERGPLGSPLMLVDAYSRAIVPGKLREAGNSDYTLKRESKSGTTDWIGAEGAIYCLSKDGTLHMFKGARP